MARKKKRGGIVDGKILDNTRTRQQISKRKLKNKNKSKKNCKKRKAKPNNTIDILIPSTSKSAARGDSIIWSHKDMEFFLFTAET